MTQTEKSKKVLQAEEQFKRAQASFPGDIHEHNII